MSADRSAASRRKRRTPEEVARQLRAQIATVGITEKVEVRVADLVTLLRAVKP